MTDADRDPRTRTAAAIEGRRADTERRRERVLASLADAAAAGAEVSVSGVAGRAGVDRSFLYRHRDLLAQLRATAARSASTGDGSGVSRASLQTDLLAAQQRAGRFAGRVQHLERRLCDALGEQAWRESGLGAPGDVNRLEQQITALEQQALDLRLQLDERDRDLDAARAANRELMARINAPRRPA